MARRKSSEATGPKRSGTTGREKKIYQLKITLRDIRPPIWRRVQVPDCSLARLHEIIQVVMGWENYHLYAFEINGDEYSIPETVADLDMNDASRAKLSRIIPGEKFKFTYIYDFGDSWEHEIFVETILPPEPKQHYPVCLTGKRAGPPEDVGGAWGYGDYVEAIQDPKHPRHDELLEWGGEFDPEAFDLEAVNQNLRRI